MRTDNYTQLPLGTSIDDGEIKVCPHCGKRGLAELRPDRELKFTHSQIVVPRADSSVVIVWDTCPKPLG